MDDYQVPATTSMPALNEDKLPPAAGSGIAKENGPMTDSIRKSNIRVERYLRATVLNDVVELEKRVWKKEGYREVNAPMLYFELAYLTNGLILTAFDEGVYSPGERA